MTILKSNTYVRVANLETDIGFILDCFNFSYKINDHEEEFDETVGHEELFRELKSDKLLIVNRNNKDIGFFVNNVSYTNSSIGAYCYMSPRACKMAILNLVTCAIIRGGCLAKDLNLDWIDVDTWHIMIVSLVKKFFPVISVHFIRPEYYLMNMAVKEVDFDHFQNQLSLRNVVFTDYGVDHFSLMI